jgi:hypothetical protein
MGRRHHGDGRRVMKKTPERRDSDRAALVGLTLLMLD